MRYRVTAPYVTLRLRDELAGGWSGRGFHLNSLLPEGANEDDVARLLRKGMIAELDIPAPAEPVEDKSAAEKPEPAKAAPAKASK